MAFRSSVSKASLVVTVPGVRGRIDFAGELMTVLVTVTIVGDGGVPVDILKRKLMGMVGEAYTRKEWACVRIEKGSTLIVTKTKANVRIQFLSTGNIREGNCNGLSRVKGKDDVVSELFMKRKRAATQYE